MRAIKALQPRAWDPKKAKAKARLLIVAKTIHNNLEQ
jgi:hypothetical protein